jgi:competence protein ComEC
MSVEVNKDRASSAARVPPKLSGDILHPPGEDSNRRGEGLTPPGDGPTSADRRNDPASLREFRYQPLVLCLLAMIAGILLDRQLGWSPGLYLGGVGLSCGVWWYCFFNFRKFGPQQGRIPAAIGSACLAIGILSLSAAWHHARWHWYPQDEIGLSVTASGQPIRLAGRVIAEPRWQVPSDSRDGFNYRQEEVFTRLVIQAQQLRDQTEWKNLSGRLDVIVPGRLTDIRAGDRIEVLGRVSGFSPPRNPGQFDFARYYRQERKLVVVHCPYADCLQVLQPAQWWGTDFLPQLRREFNEILWRNISPEEAAFASAIMLGNREQLSPDRREQFLRTGTAHLLAISGLHVGILASIFYCLYRLQVLNRRQSLLLTIAFVLFYAWLVEFRPPATRAAILIVTYCLGRLLGQTGFSLNLLALAGIVVLVISPFDLFKLGAQLSFLAVATLSLGRELLYPPPISDPLDRLIVSKRGWVSRWFNGLIGLGRSAFLASAIVWLIAMPLVAYHFHVVAPIGLLVNPLLLIPLTLALYSGLLVLLTGWLLPPVAFCAGKFCQWNLQWIEGLARSAEQIPLGHFSTVGPSPWGLVLFYLGLFFLAVFPLTRQPHRWTLGFALLWCLLGWWLPDRLLEQYRKLQPRALVCTFVDVGHGTSVLLQLPDGRNILYDGGSFGSSSQGYQSISGVLWQERISRLDTVIISHADLDHYNALPELSRRFRFGEVVITEQTLNSPSAPLKKLLDQLNEQGIPIRVVCAPEAGEAEESWHRIATDFRILNPPRAGTGGSDNSDSLVVLVESAGDKILLTGDIEGPGLEALLQQEPLACGLIMAPHHGSFNSDPSQFVNWSNPRVVVISGGNQRIRTEAVEIYQQPPRSVFRTDQQRAIRYIVKPDRRIIQTWSGSRWEVAETIYSDSD